ncbi:MAG: acyl--CoA ligase [Planctomyces sp.]|nr:acyl--CoA ligase [Planctomyces sp.]
MSAGPEILNAPRTAPPLLWEQFAQHAEASPERTAVHDRGVDVSYGELHARAERFAAWLESIGCLPGDRVVLLLPNSATYVAAWLGILRAGAAVVAVNPDSTAEEIAFVIRDCRPVAAVLDPKGMGRFADALHTLNQLGEPLPLYLVYTGAASAASDLSGGRILPWDFATSDAPAAGPLPAGNSLAQIIYTSGTTGPPKGVMLSHANIAANCAAILSYLSLTEHDSVLVVLPFYYSYGNSLLFTHLACGGRLVLAPDFVFLNRVLDLLQKQEVTGFAGVPSSYALLLQRSDLKSRTFPSLRYLTCAGGSLPRAHVNAVRETLPKAELFLMYGQTEATARLSTLLPEDLDRKAGSIGRGIDGVTLQVLDDAGVSVPPGEVGEIVASGDNVMAGYWNDPAGTQRTLGPQGLHTGDLATIDDEGFIFIVGRSNDLIKSGAFRVHPLEIEASIIEVAGVAEAAVVGMDDPVWGERPVAFVVPAADAPADLAARVMTHCRVRLARHKQPREVEIVDCLPRTASGKVRRSQLKSNAAEHQLPQGPANA